MRLRRFIFSASLLLSSAAALGACGGSESTGGDAATKGQALVEANSCKGCHQSDLGGSATPVSGSMAYAANITPDKGTGIGDWMDTQIKQAIVKGVDDENKALCATMPRFDKLTDEEASDIVAYLRTVAPVVREVPASTCAGK
jgi:mono/diheme cytochrome c family protein